MDVFRDRILSTLCLLFVPEEEELYLLETLDVFSVIICSFSVDLLWNNVADFQFNVKSLPDCWLYQVCTVCFLVLFGLLVIM